jgi:hypothetical protein
MDAAPPPPTDRHIVATTFGLCLVLYLLLSPGRVGGSDTTEMLRLAESLKRGSVAIEPVPGWSFQGPDGRHFSRYGLGYPILLAPFLAAGEAVARVVARFPPYYYSRLAASVVNPLLTAATAALLLRLLLSIGFSRRRSLLTALLWAFGSVAFVQTKEGLSEPTATFFLVAAAVAFRQAVLEDTPRAAVLGSAALSAAVLTRPLVAACAPAVLPWLLASRRRGRILTAAAIPALAGLLVQLAYNAVRTGSPLRFGYGDTTSMFVLPSVRELAYRFLSLWVSPGAGLLVWQPYLLLAPLGVVALARRSRKDLAVVTGVFGPLFVAVWLYSDWFAGPRLLSPALPFLTVLVAASFDARPLAGRAAGRAAFAGAFALGLLAQLPYVLVPSIRMETRLVLEGNARRDWAPGNAPLLGGWHDVAAVAAVPKDAPLVYSETGFPVGGPKEWFRRSATMNSFAFWFVHAARLGVPPPLLTVLALLLLAAALALSRRLVALTGQTRERGVRSVT